MHVDPGGAHLHVAAALHTGAGLQAPAGLAGLEPGFIDIVGNLGGPGSITVDGEKHNLGFEDCLYITMGAKDVVFAMTMCRVSWPWPIMWKTTLSSGMLK